LPLSPPTSTNCTSCHTTQPPLKLHHTCLHPTQQPQIAHRPAPPHPPTYPPPPAAPPHPHPTPPVHAPVHAQLQHRDGLLLPPAQARVQKLRRPGVQRVERAEYAGVWRRPGTRDLGIVLQAELRQGLGLVRKLLRQAEVAEAAAVTFGERSGRWKRWGACATAGRGGPAWCASRPRWLCRRGPRASAYFSRDPGLSSWASVWKDVGKSRKAPASGENVGSRMPPFRRMTYGAGRGAAGGSTHQAPAATAAGAGSCILAFRIRVCVWPRECAALAAGRGHCSHRLVAAT
jgi:hypothetical protein